MESVRINSIGNNNFVLQTELLFCKTVSD